MTERTGSVATIQMGENLAVLRHRVDRLEEQTPKILKMEKEILVITQKLEDQSERLDGIAEDSAGARSDIAVLTKHIDRGIWIGLGVVIAISVLTGVGASNGWTTVVRVLTG